MAKFCGNCGAQLRDDAKICGQCGKPLSGVNTADVPGIKYEDPEKEKETRRKRKKAIRLCVGLAALVLVIVIAVNVISAFTGCNGLLRKVMAAYKTYDIDSLAAMSSDIYYYGSEDYAENYFESEVGYLLDFFDSSVGHNYKLSYEVNEIYKVSNRNYAAILSDLTWMYSDFDASIIEEIAIADVTVTAQQGGSSAKRDIEVTMTKEDGTWKVLYID